MSIFDPLGLMNFLMIDVKILLPKTWQCGVGWDEQIPKSFGDKWKRWLATLKEVDRVKVPRHYFSGWMLKDCVTELHIFADAGEAAYATVAYFRTQCGDAVNVSLIGSKVKVAPLRPVSLPRMELMAAVLAARFGVTIVNGHDVDIKSVTYWSDSKTVLTWINTEPHKYKQFVKFRIGEIQELTERRRWFYIPTKVNIADWATKAAVNPEINLDSEWFNGPNFLWQSKDEWPQFAAEVVENQDELKQEYKNLVAIATPVTTSVNVNRFSKWERLLRTMAYVIMFVSKLKNRNKRMQSQIGQEEMKLAEKYLIRTAQEEAYGMEIRQLKENPHVNMRKRSALRKLSPFLDEEGILE